MKKMYSMCFCGLLIVMTTNQVLATKPVSIREDLYICNLQPAQNLAIQEQLPKIAAYLTEKLDPDIIDLKIRKDIIDSKIYTLIPYIPNPAHGSADILPRNFTAIKNPNFNKPNHIISFIFNNLQLSN